jgi:hypothetical protein
MVVTPMKEKIRYDPYAVNNLIKSRRLSSRRIEQLSNRRISKSWVCGLTRRYYKYAKRDKLLVLSEVLDEPLERLIMCDDEPGHPRNLSLVMVMRRFLRNA